MAWQQPNTVMAVSVKLNKTPRWDHGVKNCELWYNADIINTVKVYVNFYSIYNICTTIWNNTDMINTVKKNNNFEYNMHQQFEKYCYDVNILQLYCTFDKFFMYLHCFLRKILIDEVFAPCELSASV